MGLRYIGSKARVATRIADILGRPTGGGEAMVDGFCGTGAVATAAAQAGWSIRLNDQLYSSATMAAARLVTTGQASFNTLGGYDNTLSQLNSVRGLEGSITREYSPVSALLAGVERRYFTEQNARRIDGVRSQIEEWRVAGGLSDPEFRLLLADLMVASNKVANIAGTYGCFLREWSPVALKTISLTAQELLPRAVNVEVHVGDVLEVPYGPDDVAYFDPPYTKRQYAAYYHILETIAAGDSPVVEGITGLRPWKHLASDYCYRSKALRALSTLVSSCPARRILLSYSSEGHVTKADLKGVLADHGELIVHRLGPIGRYRPNRAAAASSTAVQEYVFEVLRTTDKLRSVA